MTTTQTPARPAFWLATAALSAALCLTTWFAAQSRVDVAPVLDGAPATVTVVYDPQWLTLSLLAAMATGIAMVLGVAGWLRARKH